MKAFSLWRQTLATLHAGEARRGHDSEIFQHPPRAVVREHDMMFFAKRIASASFGWFLRGVFLRRNIRPVVVYSLVACSTHIRQHFVGATGAVRQSRVGITSTCCCEPCGMRSHLAHASMVPKVTRSVSFHHCWKWDVGINQLSLTRYPALKPSLRLLLLLRRSASWMVRQRSCRPGAILERRCACDEETANLSKEHSQRDHEYDHECEFCAASGSPRGATSVLTNLCSTIATQPLILAVAPRTLFRGISSRNRCRYSAAGWCCDQKVELTPQPNAWNSWRLCCQSLHLARPARRKKMTSWRERRRMGEPS